MNAMKQVGGAVEAGKVTHPEIVARLRNLAAELEWANDLYLYHREFGMWNPHNARYEADYLEANP